MAEKNREKRKIYLKAVGDLPHLFLTPVPARSLVSKVFLKVLLSLTLHYSSPLDQKTDQIAQDINDVCFQKRES